MSTDTPQPKRYLIVCTGNFCRSQMAEGWMRQLGKGRVEVLSAGSKPKGGVHPMAVEVMKERGIDLTQNTSNHIDEYINEDFDCVLTVCDSAKEACPIVPGAKRVLHHAFEDPDHPNDPNEEPSKCFRRVRDQIGNWVEGFLDAELTGFAIGNENGNRRQSVPE
ncbi:MAG: arsenate reductase ArsC [Phycisphaeraceae bacterium]|nr:arsenate reductase ArsC [Phycisphaeraceae bacterium]